MNPGRISFLFLNVGHTYAHLFMLLYPTVVLALEAEFQRPYGVLLALATPGFVAFGAGALPAGWIFSTNQIAGIFGSFEFALTGPVDNEPSTIMPLEIETFTFTILGVGPFFGTDFTTEFSTNPPGDMTSPVAAKFVFGSRMVPAGDPGADSAYGGIPEPGVLALLAVAGLVGARRRRRSTA